ncbi:acyl-CoA dehydrogenase family protein [Roseibium sp. RKSG952]|uniref:acyl-CoA dehydrogenase family protein n=1 Tax=Roseibium sp. RKSG952 TaxID=2529384 RepID=UPI0012BBB704|nr:acyl-CoA dehydrogenase family protein [Roseibium sp. RKSG952]MTH95907.1 pimeloyl-CoA dehydrogenase small subunit [Roseibium sp. RKSG952]
MDFTYSEEQSLIADSLRRLLGGTCDRSTRKRILADGLDHNPGTWKALSELGLLGLPVAEAYDGIGGNAVDTMVAAIEFGQYLALEPFTASVVLGGGAIGLAGSEDQKRRYLPAIAGGAKKCSVALLEPGGRFDLGHVETTARTEGGTYRLYGRKSVAIGAPSADVLIVSARTGAFGSRSMEGLTLFLIPADAPGVTLQSYRLADGRSCAEITLQDAAVSIADVLGEENRAGPVIEHVADLGAAAYCAEALGALDRIIALTTDYLKVRTQFGRPIGEFQALQHQLAEMVIDAEHARSLVYEASMTVDGHDPERRRKAVSAAKVFLAERGRLICQKAMQMHGGIGMTEDYELGDYVKRVMVAELAFGDADHHLERYAASF